MDDLTKRVIRLESVVAQLDAELLAYQSVLAWLLNTFHHPEAAPFLLKLTKEFDEKGKYEGTVRSLNDLREKYDIFYKHRTPSETNED
ncbi:MAG: hypothetical protein JNL77_08760 [Nitrosomonas sp.]|nr:hypothetical protein [Nitrosomonas sp.]